MMKMIQPFTEQHIIHRVTTNFFQYNGWPTISRDENGDLYTVASCFRAWHICPMGKTAMFISHDDGGTWTKPMVINDTYLDDRDAGILCMGNGKILITWFTLSPEQLAQDPQMLTMAPEPIRNSVASMTESYAYLNEEQSRGGSYAITSEDGGITWSDPIRVPISAPHGPTLCRDGSLLYLGKVIFDGEEVENESICAYRSTDFGHTWELMSILSIPEGMSENQFHEPHVIELSNGTLLSGIRAHTGNGGHYRLLYQSESYDRGKTWSVMHPTNLLGYPGHLLQHSSGAVVCVYAKRNGTESGEFAAVSYDMGKTWTEEYLIAQAKDGDCGYPASVELDDGSILTVYYQKYGDDNYPSVLCTRWNLAEKS